MAFFCSAVKRIKKAHPADSFWFPAFARTESRERLNYEPAIPYKGVFRLIYRPNYSWTLALPNHIEEIIGNEPKKTLIPLLFKCALEMNLHEPLTLPA
jgi:hypothetical protein